MASISTYPFTRPTQPTSPFVSSPPPSLTSSNRLTTPLAPPPPPPLYMSSHDHLSGPERQIRYAGADHTLGPTFSEEEDGDDTAFIAAKMAALGLDPNGRPYTSQNGFQQEPATFQPRDNRTRNPLAQAQSQAQAQLQIQIQAQRQAQMQYLTQQAQQQQALLHLLSQQNQSQPNAQLREAMALLELQQVQQSATDRLAYAQQAQRAYNQASRQPGWDQTQLSRQERERDRLQYLQQQQQQQQQQIREMQYLQDLHIQQQLATLQLQSNDFQSQSQSQSRPNSNNSGSTRTALSAQMQANLQARTGRVAQARGMGIALDDSELRARFEHATETYTPPPSSFDASRSSIDNSSITSPSTAGVGNSPTSPSSWRSTSTPSPTKTNILTPTELPTPSTITQNTSSVRSPKGGRFSQATQAMAAEGTDKPYGTLTSALSGKSLFYEAQNLIQSATVPIPSEKKKQEEIDEKEEVPSSPTVEKKSLKYTLGALGNGRPSSLPSNVNANRAVTLPAPQPNSNQATQRAVSQPVCQQAAKMFVVRQPHGPPCEASELGDKNFQSRLRRKAGLNLTMLNRRTESPCPTPLLA